MLDLSACSKDPCDENPNLIICLAGDTETGGSQESGDSGETGKPLPAECVPLKDDQVGHTYECLGSGNGWLQLSVYPVGAQDPECLSWGDQPRPKHPTVDDCVAVDLVSLPNNVPGPGACCTEQALPDSIIQECNDDCGHAACKLAVEKLREAALSLSTKGAEGVVRLDLFYLANVLEMPSSFAKCVTEVAKAGGELTPVQLGPGSSKTLDIGHVESATIHLQCALDEFEPYAFVGNICDAAPNMPIIEEESHMGGIAAAGTVTVIGPGGDASTSLYDISFGFTETLHRSGSVEFRLEDFTARSSTAAYGSFVVTEPSLRLVAPASGMMTGERITFPPGSLRVEVTAAITADGQPLFDGRPVSGVYVNSASATADPKRRRQVLVRRGDVRSERLPVRARHRGRQLPAAMTSRRKIVAVGLAHSLRSSSALRFELMQNDRVALGVEDHRHPAHRRVDHVGPKLDALRLEP